MENMFRLSRERLPRIDREEGEILCAGYYRISRTSGLIQECLDNDTLTPYDRLFWEESFFEEAGHDLAFADDMRQLYSEKYANQMLQKYTPCPETVAHLDGIQGDPLKLGVYRAYLELGFCAMQPSEKTFFRLVLPRTMAIHEDADPRHAKACLQYLESFQREAIKHEILQVQQMLTAEIKHKGLL